LVGYEQIRVGDKLSEIVQRAGGERMEESRCRIS
jgi:hypothetical protein